MSIHDKNNGAANIWRNRFLPKHVAKYPAGMAPKNAPRVIRDPIHEPSSFVTLGSEVGLWSIGIAGELHDKHAPLANALRVAKNYL